MLGATGAVGTAALSALLAESRPIKITTLGRRSADGLNDARLDQKLVDIHDPNTYVRHLAGAQVALCTLGVGEPSKVSKEEFVRIDKDAVLAFAKACKAAGVKHFELLSSVGANASSRNFYLRTKGQLQDELLALGFERLSLFQPSMILTPTNRYGVAQALTLAVWPYLGSLMWGPAKKLRGIPVAELGKAMAYNMLHVGTGVEILQWPDFKGLASNP